jgi:hypothetical protein
MTRIFTLKEIEDFVIFLSIFLSSFVFFKTPFEGYFHYLIFILYLPFFINRYGFPKPVFNLLSIPFLTSIICVFLNDNTWFNFIKIFVGMLLSCSFYYYVLVHYKFDTVKLFRLYLKGCIIVAIIGFIQAISYKLNFTFGYNYSWLFNKWGISYGGIIGIRMNSILSEPSQFATIISPAVFICIHHLLTRSYIFIKRKWCFVLLLAAVLSASSTGYLGVLFSIIIIVINFRRFLDLIVVSVIGFFAAFLLYVNIEEFRSRVDASLKIYQEEELTVNDINSSSFVQYNNLHVATTNFANHPFFGTGLGSYPLAYEKYSLTKAEDFLIKKGFEFNAQDANSLFFRVIAELGLLGALFLIIVVFRCFVIRDDIGSDHISWLISGAVLVLILLYYLRQGNYFVNGFPFFMWLYYYNYINRREYLKSIS